jgi:hypothetical protein
VIDPRNPSTSESNANTWSLVTVPGSEWMDTKDVPHGAVGTVYYYSTALQRTWLNWRNYLIEFAGQLFR